MEPQLKRRKFSHPTTNPFPISSNPLENQYQYTGYFMGRTVEICNLDSMTAIHTNGCFGVGSRTQQSPEVLCGRHATESLSVGESLVLFPEEAFFLHYSLKCLKILDLNDVPLCTEHIFEQFRKLDFRFVENFVAYLYLKSKNWVIKSGLKFGGDFLLYKEGPRFYHASYIVLIGADESNQMKSLSVMDLQGHHRVAEASKKELLIIEVKYPSSVSYKSPAIVCLDNLQRFTASEVIPKRFNIHREL